MNNLKFFAPRYLKNLSAVARYFGKPLPGFSFELIEGSIVDLAKHYEKISYPGIEKIDAIVNDDDTEIIFSCTESVKDVPVHPLAPMNLFFDENRGVFIDRTGCYRRMRSLELCIENTAGSASLTLLNLLEAAALVSCFGFKPGAELLKAFGGLSDRLETLSPEKEKLPAPVLQRLYLSAVVSGDYPAAGLNLLRDFGAVEALWPELYALVGIDQSKEYHPEGDVWDHSLETLYHRKTNNPELSMALLLHDIGKPLSDSAFGNRFNNHAQIGGHAAAGFLRRLEFPEDKIEKICFLVENHMMPAAIKTLPSFRTEKAMLSPWFPLLLEVYRCDLLSTFMGPEGYYEACKAYRKFVKNTKNPFRNADGKKLYRLYVE